MMYVTPIAKDVSRILLAVTKVKLAVELQKSQLPYYSAVDFQHLVIANLNSQKYASGYASYSEMYKEWKLEQQVGMKFWALYNDLVQNIKAFRVPLGAGQSGWIAGVVPGVTASISSQMWGTVKKKVLIAQYARWMEFGRKGQPARPLFGPTKNEYRRGGFPKRGQQSLNKIKWSWS